jgi:hypothetical protein
MDTIPRSKSTWTAYSSLPRRVPHNTYQPPVVNRHTSLVRSVKSAPEIIEARVVLSLYVR